MRKPSALALVLTAMSLYAAPLPPVPVYGYRVVRTYPHDPSAFTQGLEYRGGFLYEGTGLNGRSTLRKVELQTGEVLQEIHLDSQYFGEGITALDQRILELTWQSHHGFVYNRGTFQLIRTFDYVGEGWGLTNDGSQIVMSEGTPAIPSGILRRCRNFAAPMARWTDFHRLTERVGIRSGRNLRQCLAD